ncbi:glutamate racemase [Salegentibacter sp. BLCTC]|uniref:Glutamate racemase n=1 Tax=Salegentibacter maritimus TaxID=2794347 RepID=A0ABS0TE46_9FLAO|nr:MULTISPECIES: glutamate racemase [Salegentibacter]MBE7640708.1 glutamate racemase [Salegentibacter sp. BLCTC]MBI6119237.1 glutamate racemase [Salegentibacter maritimus]
MSTTQPIGIFDSGVGGTSIWREVHELLPFEKTIYLADSKNAPYGEKPIEEIKDLSRKNTEKLLDMGAKIIIVACNTATTNAIKELRNEYSIPFIGIEPAIKPAALKSKSKTIGILATRGTLTSTLFSQTSDFYAKNINIVEVEGRGLVELIEAGELDSPQMRSLLLKLLEPFFVNKIDYLVLGCSHYPYLIPLLKELLPEDVIVIDSGEAVARQTKSILSSNNLLANEQTVEKPVPEFFSNTNPKVLEQLTEALKYAYKVSYLDF